MQPVHNFHIPVMGLSFTIDSPIRVAQFGIDSVVSIVDDELIEKMRAFYSEKFKQPYEEISKKVEDYRAKRITSYLDLVDGIVKEKFDAFKSELLGKRRELENFLSFLPSNSDLRARLDAFIQAGKSNFEELQQCLDQYLRPGSIDVNIMTKIDKDNFKDGDQLPVEFNDAHAALRGFAYSQVESSLVLSAGMNPRLYSYIGAFDVFYPNQNGEIKKKIILKVSDFRSALIQGNFLAKKGIWVSEYRIESGLNCGGHAFATEGYLLGPILNEFKEKQQELIDSPFALLAKALAEKDRPVPRQPLPLKITVQGGVGTAEEHQFLLANYPISSVGWGSPFLLVPEATSVDKDTRKLLADAGEKDFYLSNISPLGVLFNAVKGTTNEFFKNKRIEEGKAGSSCPKKYLALSKEYDAEGICTASKKFQDIKLEDLNAQKSELSVEDFERQKFEITEKSCLCVGLANSGYLEAGIPIKGQKQGVVVCPGPNLAYYSEEVSLKQMLGHIYGYGEIKVDENRPNMFMKELSLYVAYMKDQMAVINEMTTAQVKKWTKFKDNLLDGIAYYQELFSSKNIFENQREKVLLKLEEVKAEVENIQIEMLGQGSRTSLIN